MNNQVNNQVISIDEFVDRLDEWKIQGEPYVYDIQGNKMLGIAGANFVAYKCGISVDSETVEETDTYIESMAVANYREITAKGTKRQVKKGSNAPLEMSHQKARRNAICNLIPEDVIIGVAEKPPIQSPYLKAAKAIGEAHSLSQSAARDDAVKADLESLGIDVTYVLEKAKESNGDDTTIWGVLDWQRLEHMLRNPKDWGLSKGVLVDESDATDVVGETEKVDELDTTDVIKEED